MAKCLKRLCIYAIIFVCFVLFVGCGNPDTYGQKTWYGRDWFDDSLPNGYRIVHYDAAKIVCQKVSETGEILEELPKDVLAYAYNERYVALVCRPLPDDPGDTTPIWSYESSEYYVIDTQMDFSYGPYTADEYDRKYDDLLERNVIDKLGPWCETRSVPPMWIQILISKVKK